VKELSINTLGQFGKSLKTIEADAASN